MDGEQTHSASTDRYNKKKDAIIAAAAGIINRRGVKGMTLADVAASVDLITTSVTYYFKKKEDLAVACFLRGIERLDALVSRAVDEKTPHERLHKVVGLCLEMDRSIREGEDAPLAMFSDVRTLREPHISLVAGPYADLFRKIRSFFRSARLRMARPQDEHRAHAYAARTIVLVSDVAAALRRGGLSAHP